MARHDEIETASATAPVTNRRQPATDGIRSPNRLFGYAVDCVLWVIGVLLLIGTVLLAIGQISLLLKLRSVSAGAVASIGMQLLDGLLLIFIFATLLYAVGASLRDRKVAAESFLIVGILACIREFLGLVDEPAGLLKSGPQFAHSIVAVGVLGGLAVVLALAVFLLRAQRQSVEVLPD